MKYENLSKIKIEHKSPSFLNDKPLKISDIEIGKLVIDNVHFVGTETMRIDDEKTVTAKVAGDYKLIVEGEENKVRVYFDITRTKDDNFSSLVLDVEDIRWIKTAGFNFEDMTNEIGEELIIKRNKEILHLITLNDSWLTLKAWFETEFRYRFSF